MINKRFSIHDAYTFGFKSVLNNFAFFLSTMVAGSVASLLFLSFVGVVDFWLFKEHFMSLVHMFSNALHNATGAIHSAGHTVHDHLNTVLPSAFAKHVAPADAISIDISGQDLKDLAIGLLPLALAFKLFVDMISVGWTKLALDMQSNKAVSVHYVYQFYYLVPRVFVVGLVVGLVTLVGLMLFIIPGVFAYQRLRFARYYVIDKNQSILQALESSWKMTDGAVLHLIGYSMFAAIVESVGNMVPLFSFVLLPLGYQVDANVYRQMIK